MTDIKHLDDNGFEFDMKQVDGKLRVSAMPYTYDIAEGSVENHSPFRRFGINADVGTSWETITNTNTAQNYLSSAERLKIASTDVNDDGDPASTGALTMILRGLDGDYEIVQETITLNGQTAVTTTNSFLRPLVARIQTVGSSGANEGTITIKNNAADTTLLQINVGEGESNNAVWTVPNGQKAYITNWNGAESSSKGSVVGLWWREYGKSWVLKRAYAVLDSSFYHDFHLPMSVPAKADIELRGYALQAGSTVTGGFDGWYEEV